MNIADFISRHAAERPDHIAIVDGARTIDYRSLEHAIWRAVADLRVRNVTRGEIVATAMPSSALHLVAIYALARLGAIQIPLWPGDPKAINKRMISKFKIPRMLCEEGKVPNIDLPTLTATWSWLDTDAPTPVEDVAETDPDRPLKIVLSSGTTGDPKAFPVTHAIELGWYSRMAPADCFGPDAVFLQAIDMAYPYGLRLCLHHLTQGGRVVIMPEGMTADLAFGLIDRHEVTHLGLTPSMAAPLIAAAGAIEKPRCSTVRHLSLGGAIVTLATRTAVRQRITRNLYVQYGSNEVGFLTSASPDLLDRFPETIGLPISGVEVQVVDDRDRPVPAGEIGAIRVRGRNFAEGYIDHPEATRRAFRDGWFYPGDLGSFGTDGELYFKGRVDDLMNYNGIKIVPTDIEDMLRRHPAVSDAAAFSLPHPIHQDVPAAAVTVAAPVASDALVAFGRQNLGARAPHFVAIVPALPRNALGKVLKRDLARQVLKKITGR